MDILVSNDDGVTAQGLLVLRDTLSTIASLKVIAPDRNRSGASNSLTLSRPLRIKLLENGFYSVEGTPTDCVHLALTGYFKKKFDIVVSGINQGANLGDHIESSKTKIQQDIDAKELEWSNHPKIKYEQDLMNPGVTIEVQVSKEEIVKPDYPDYYALRRNEYPKIGDQLDALWKGIDSPEFTNVMNKIQEVKQKYPKA